MKTEQEIKKVTSTELEFKVLKCLIDELYAEAGFSDIGCKDIADILKINANTVKGTIGSLTKKGIVSVGEGDFKDIIYLNNVYWYLHPEWSEFDKEFN